MWQNYIAATLRSLAHNKLYSSICVLGLTTGLYAVIVAGLIVRGELSHDRFIPGHQKTALIITSFVANGRAPVYADCTPTGLAALLKLQFNEIEAVARLKDEEVMFRGGDIEASEKIYWADPTIFEVLPLPVFAGDLSGALRRPDGIVLTQAVARKYFGTEAAIGRTIQVDRIHLMTVTAVVKDLPINGTQLQSGIFASGLAAYSALAKLDNDPSFSDGSRSPVVTYIRITPDASFAHLQSVLPGIMDKMWPKEKRPPGVSSSLHLVQLDQVHLFPGFNPDINTRLTTIALIGALILIIAGINFVNLTTARSSRRAREVGVRKVCGATRSVLILQFLCESIIFVLLATCFAGVLIELTLPRISVLINTNAYGSYWSDPSFLALTGVGVLLVGILAGIYPAFILSLLRPSTTLKGFAQSAGGGVRQLLIVLQFAILIGLASAAVVIYQQYSFATRESLRIDSDQILIIWSPCNEAFKNELLVLPGVRGAGCASENFLIGMSVSFVKLKDGSTLTVNSYPIDSQVFDVYAVRPVAGRLFSSGLGSSPLPKATESSAPEVQIVVNETAVRRLGFGSPQSAIGQEVDLYGRSEIIGVVPDFSLASIKEKIGPTVYTFDPNALSIINVKLTGQIVPETLDAIDRLWAESGATRPIKRLFLDAYIQNRYRGILQEAQAFNAFALIAALLASLGLVGLSTSTTERRAKEIGIRKAMGAGTAEVMRLLVWQFSKPVLWANLIAWPVAGFVMNRWLQGFAYHVDLEPWLFVVASAAALLIALLTVSAHCYLVARAKPIAALRYE